MRRSCLVWLAMVLGAIAVPLRAEKVAAMPAPTGYVDDYAGVISAPAKTEIEGLCREVHDKTKAQVFFVTIKTLDGETVETFANELFHNWKIGEKKTDRGVLLLLAVNDHKRWIEVGYGFEGILPDGKVGDIGREMVPALKNANYDEAARIGTRDVAKVIAADAGVTLDALGNDDAAAENAVAAPVSDSTGQTVHPLAGLLLIFVMFGGGIGLFVLLVVMNIRRGVRFGGGGGVGGTGFSSSSDSGSSFGGDSGGSSDSFSGGDGGDSGGGGAGGSW